MAAKNPSLVHTEETTIDPTLPEDYRTYRRRQCEPEWLRTEWLYSSIDESEGTDRLTKFHDCRQFAWFARNKHNGTVRVLSNSCKLRWCPICSKARSMHLEVTVGDWLASLDKPKFSTFTMKHTDAPLQHQIKWLYDHFRKFRNRKKIRKYFRGGIWFFQLKRSSTTNEWHPHLHCILDSDYIPKELLQAEWLAQTLTSNVVDIRAVQNPEKVAEYVARYCSRPANLAEFSEDDCIEIFTVFHGKRLCGSWGTGRQAGLTSKPTSDRGDWLNIGSWKQVVKMRYQIPRCAEIIRCWKTGTPLADGITIDPTIDSAERYISRAPPNVGVEDINFNWKGLI